MQIRVTKEFCFEMAHALFGYDGPCSNIHGHSYKLSVTLKGVPVKDITDPKVGMVVDFSEIKKWVNAEIIKPFDHALVLNKNTPQKLLAELKDQKLIMFECQPTCENLLIHFVEKIKKIVPTTITIHHIMLRETATSYAEWYAEDNDLSWKI